jgi:hypothetical protein
MSFKVIDGDGPSKENRERERERETVEFSWAIRDCAANMLRIIRGAGQPYELLVQMQEVTRAALKVQETHGYWPQNVITNNLRLEDRIEGSATGSGRFDGSGDLRSLVGEWRVQSFDG